MNLTKSELEIIEKLLKEFTDAIKDLRSRVKSLEERKPETVVHQHYYNNPMPVTVPVNPLAPPWIVTCGGSTSE